MCFHCAELSDALVGVVQQGRRFGWDALLESYFSLRMETPEDDAVKGEEVIARALAMCMVRTRGGWAGRVVLCPYARSTSGSSC